MATLLHLVRNFAYKVIRFIAFSRGKRRQLSLSTRILRQMWAIRPSFVTYKLNFYGLKPATPAFSLSIRPISPSHWLIRPQLAASSAAASANMAATSANSAAPSANMAATLANAAAPSASSAATSTNMAATPANAAATSVNSVFCGRGARTTSSFRPSSCRQKAERSPGGCSLPSRRTCPYGQSPPWCSCWRRA